MPGGRQFPASPNTWLFCQGSLLGTEGPLQMSTHEEKLPIRLFLVLSTPFFQVKLGPGKKASCALGLPKPSGGTGTPQETWGQALFSATMPGARLRPQEDTEVGGPG